MKLQLNPIFLVIVSVLIVMSLAMSGCSQSNKEGLAFYLTKKNISPSQMPALNQVDLAETPIIAMSDIITYNAQTHELKLTEIAYKRIAELQVPVQGTSFVVCIDKKPIYFGAFWTPVSSISFNGVTIWKPYNLKEPYILTLELGYPTSAFYGGEDPRNNSEVIAALKQAGKLVDRLSITDINQLPNTMKGYELYSWSSDNQWHFTLITGTNRIKTENDIISNENYISEAGLIHIQVTGMENIQQVLNKIPQDENVIWSNGRISGSPATGINFTLPDESIIETIKEQAQQSHFKLMVSTH